MTLVFTANDVKNDVSLCKLDVNVTERRSLVASVSLDKRRDSLKEKRKTFYFIASSTSKVKCDKS